MIEPIKAKRYKIEFIVDTILCEKRILKLMDAFDCYMIKIEETK